MEVNLPKLNIEGYEWVFEKKNLKKVEIDIKI